MEEKYFIKLIAFDLDGTLTQHKSPLTKENLATLDALGKKYKLLMLGAGSCERIFKQMGGYHIDIIGNYGMQYAIYSPLENRLETVRNEKLPCDRESIEKRVTALREKYGFTNFIGDNVEFHESGCITIPLLGTKAKLDDKLSFDPDRSKRQAMYAYVKELFSDYTVFIGGSSSFDMAPAPYDKVYALSRYCEEHHIAKEEAIYVGDDYGNGGNDESVYKSDFNFYKIDNYLDFPKVMHSLL